MNRVSSLSRLLMLNGAAFLCLVIASMTAAGGVLYLQHQVTQQATDLNRMVQTIHVLRGDLYRQLKELFDYVFIGDPDALVEFEAFNEQIEENLGRLEGFPQDDAFARELETLRQSYESLRGRARAIMNQVEARYSAAELLEVFEAELEQGRMLAYERAFEVTEAMVEAARLDLDKRIARHRGFLLAALIVPLVAGLALLLMTQRMMKRQVAEPVGALLAAAEAYRKGQLKVRLAETGPSEFLALQQSFNRMAGDLEANQAALIERETQATMGALVPIIAHNIRNPLASIRATAQVMQVPDGYGTDESDQQAQELQGIIRTVDRLEDWLSLLITYLNPLKPRKAPASMSVIADQALHMLAHAIRDKNLEVVRHNPDQESELLADRNLLEQAVSGLLHNAIDASPQGATLTLEIDESADDMTLAVLDDGPGMPFAEGPSGLVSGPTTKVLGSGLGVPFARKVCEIHGGAVTFEPRHEGGTRTLLRLPKHRASPPDASAAAR